ncbi:MAG TPA: hypothetical protein DEB30_04750 [Candidatus Peribacter riflensis]|uniref:von Willebrand factor A n=1 Tax=Candidatus Peribacter riflensis TaxID=1735162 RepID=A0A0S1SHT8_9BACT|nr:MAG: von Willebrand factor A [Candidatus Peribacter riflensis]ALM10883.1 MAG: von Willebrand factor A [Candidatus Peribacter riflensis]ALM11985.1 MAG: von Willebrand factor A [Candidatus Peribacter riflensis]ALM13088.1 MAG: von Willebrand factor A [Candidatus Peribacter riflensis]ALM14188.1 MAG: von Willebrand factor A [Candidatus Peribacter riflensis]
MTKRHNILTGQLLCMAGILFLTLAVAEADLAVPSTKERWSMPYFSFGVKNVAAAEDAFLVRVAHRLSARIARRVGTSPPISVLVTALQEQRTLLTRHTTVTLQIPGNQSYRTWDVHLQKYPTWMKAEISPASAHFRVDEERIAQFLTTEPMDGIIQPQQAVITAVTKEDDVERVVTSTGAARPGIIFDMSVAPRAIAAALTEGTETVAIPLVITSGPVENLSGVPLGDLVLLGSGKSDFKGSPSARIYNVRKAIHEHVNNVLVPPGAEFSFNETLGGPVSNGNGWKDAKVIFNTTELRMAPGGGICQASTTVFRAILQSGFGYERRANHSMYVSYYEKYGVGIDATVFPGKQDLTFVNDTANYLLFQAYTEGSEVTVQIYGTPDGRTSEVIGPFFSSSDFTDYPAEERTPRGNEIAWVQRITFADGREKKRVITSRYTSLPRSLAKKYETAVHASAEQKAM